jgi:hypothetical protein
MRMILKRDTYPTAQARPRRRGFVEQFLTEAVHPPPEAIMDPLAALHSTPKAWLLNNVLAPHADAFASRLREGRYSSMANS